MLARRSQSAWYALECWLSLADNALNELVGLHRLLYVVGHPAVNAERRTSAKLALSIVAVRLDTAIGCR